jgi:hypothetical protein
MMILDHSISPQLDESMREIFTVVGSYYNKKYEEYFISLHDDF